MAVAVAHLSIHSALCAEGSPYHLLAGAWVRDAGCWRGESSWLMGYPLPPLSIS
jgi:hypothetical protein